MVSMVNFALIAPELMLLALGVWLLIVAMFARSKDDSVSRAIPGVAVAGLAIALLAVILVGVSVSAASGSGVYADAGRQLRIDTLSQFYKGIAVLATLIVVLMSVRFARRFDSPGEFHALLVLTTLGACLLASASDLVTIYLCMEYLSITSYAMAGYYRENRLSNEAALKYFIYGALNSALMLYGLSLLYGLSAMGSRDMAASTNLTDVLYGLVSQPVTALGALALVFATAGFLFKVSAAPFHQWAPDTYQGAPAPFTAFLAVTSVVGGLAVLTRVAATVFSLVNNTTGHNTTHTLVLSGVLAISAALSMTIGNVMAIQQRDLKRILAFSGIAQIGYVLVAVAAMRNGNADEALRAVLIYAATYLFMNLGAWAVVVALNNNENTTDIKGLTGLSERNPLLAAAMAIFMLSLSGIPPFAGWFGKYYIFVAAIAPRLNGVFFWLAMVLVVNSVIAAYYYLNIVRTMYFSRPDTEQPMVLDPWLKAGVVVSVVFTVLLGVIIAPLYNAASDYGKLRVDPPVATYGSPLAPR